MKLLLFLLLALFFFPEPSSAQAPSTPLTLVGIINDSTSGISALIEDPSTQQQDLFSVGDWVFKKGEILEINNKFIKLKYLDGKVDIIYLSGGTGVLAKEDKLNSEKSGVRAQDNRLENYELPDSPLHNAGNTLNSTGTLQTKKALANKSLSDQATSDKALSDQADDQVVSDLNEQLKFTDKTDAVIPLDTFAKVLQNENTLIGKPENYESILDNNNKQLGVIVSKDDSSAFLKKVGIKKGDIITAVNTNPVSDFDSMSKAFMDPSQKRILIYFTRDGERQSLSIAFGQAGQR